MKRIAFALLALLLTAALPLSALSEAELLSEAVDLVVPEEEDVPLGGGDEGAVSPGGTAVSAVDDTPIDSYNFPDENFRKHVLDHFDKDKNFMLSVAERSIVYSIDVSELGISSLEGIEFFTNITELDCRKNGLTSLDVSANTQLKELDCSYNDLTGLDVSGLARLSTMNCSWNPLTSLKLSGCPIATLYCFDTGLESMDLSAVPDLYYLSCGFSKLTSLDVSGNPALNVLLCAGNYDLTELDLSHNAQLRILNCQYNPIRSVDLSGNPLMHACARTTPTLNEDDKTALFLDEDYTYQINISQSTALVIDGETAFDTNPGYHIAPERDEYTINLAHGDTVRVNCALSFYRDEKNAKTYIWYSTGVNETVAVCDMSANPVAFTGKDGRYVGDAFFDLKGLKTGTVYMRIGVYVDDRSNQYDEQRITIHVIDDAGAAPTSPTPPPAEKPTAKPTAEPTDAPTTAPTGAPTTEPTDAPTTAPTGAPEADPVSISKARITGVKDAVYTGKAIKPEPVVKLGGATLVKDTDYTVTYKNNKKTGVATVTVTGIGGYTDKLDKTFAIKPKAVELAKLTPGKGKLTVKWKKGAGGITGYQIRYGLKKSFAGSKKLTVEKAGTVKATLNKLKSKKTYYVQIRAYKRVGKKTLYSGWSKAGTVKTK